MVALRSAVRGRDNPPPQSAVPEVMSIHGPNHQTTTVTIVYRVLPLRSERIELAEALTLALVL